MNRTSVLIAGHGYVGSALANTLQEEGASVTVLNRSAVEGVCYLSLKADLGNLDSITSAAELLETPPDVIIHCAASGRGGGIESYRSVYVDGMRHLQQAFPGVPILYTSSTGVYGQDDGSVITETSETSPGRETGELLLEAEAIALETGGIVLRLAGIYGPGRSIYLQRLLEGTATIDPGWPSRHLNQIHLTDIVGALLHFLTSGISPYRGRIFNVVDGTRMTQRECYEGLAQIFDLPIPPEAPSRPGPRGVTNKIVSSAALKATVWEPIYPSYFDAIKKDPDLVASILDKIGGNETN
ncbi:MAG: NAD-dependent epimerase/dehydratase family protein [Verrucomicrobiota bacterium]